MTQNPNLEDIEATVEELLKDPEQTFVLSTMTEDGYPDSRIMGNICQKSLEEIYFTCQTGSRKTEQITANPHCSVYMTKDKVTAWIYGEATVTREESERKKIWSDRVLRIYHEGVNSPRLTVIRIVPKKVRFRDGGSDYVEFEL